MARLRDSWRTSLPVAQQPRNPQSESIARTPYDSNDYSVPTAYGHRPVLVGGYVDEVVIACGAEIIARHPRSYEREDFIFEPDVETSMPRRAPTPIVRAPVEREPSSPTWAA